MVTDYIDRTKELLYFGAVRRLVTPIEVYLELTNTCNLRCIYCYKKGLNIGAPKFFDENLLPEILEDLHSVSPEPILFVLEGGEPLLHPNCIKLIKLIKKFNDPIDILTNGELLNSEIILNVSDCFDRANDEFQISLDGISEYALLNRGNNWKKVFENIKMLNAFGIYPRINTVITKYNIREIIKFLEYLSNTVNVKSVSLNSVIGRKNIAIRASISDKIKLEKEIDEKDYNFHIFKSFLHNVCDYDVCTENCETISEFYMRCTAMTGKLCISVDGDVYPCVFYEGRMTPLGSLRKKKILDIWGSSEAEHFLFKRNNHLDKCVHCILNKSCTQICAGNLL